MDYLQELIGTILVGLLSLLWWDLRGSRKDAKSLTQTAQDARFEMEALKREIEQERTKLKDEVYSDMRSKFEKVEHRLYRSALYALLGSFDCAR